tara:strand:+ start:1380 stop:1862 length:483 start_codon:yes stop_codon:yes gene_type:complete
MIYNQSDVNRIALYQPRIPQNTGNIARTCAAFKFYLDLIGPLGFSLDDRYLKRAGLDYWDYVNVTYYDSIDNYLTLMRERRLIGFSKSANKKLSEYKFIKGDIYLFGREDSGIPINIQNKINEMIKIPMPGAANQDGSKGVRSLNLSVAVGIVAYISYLQ